MIELDIPFVIAWKWNRPHTRRGQIVEIEGIGVVAWEDILLAHQEWLVSEKPRQLAKAELQATDFRMARPMEDLIDLLVASGGVNYANLPQAVRDLIERRKLLRAQITTVRT